jgi:hypothetical protein
MNVAILGEFSGIIRDEFIKQGHNAVSCDFLPTERPGPHVQTDMRAFLIPGRSFYGWADMFIAHPSCTYTTVAANKWIKIQPDRQRLQDEAVEFFRFLLEDVDIKMKCIEHPVSVVSTRIRKPDQYIQPWMFGHGETKKTGLWLKGLPPLVSTNIVSGREGRVWKERPGPYRWKERSRTYEGIAKAMAEQWGNL